MKPPAHAPSERCAVTPKCIYDKGHGGPCWTTDDVNRVAAEPAPTPEEEKPCPICGHDEWCVPRVRDHAEIAALRAALDAATRALERLELFLRDAKDCAKFIEHAQGMLAHAHGIAAAALAQIEGVRK